MATKKKEKESFSYLLGMLDNGIVLEDPMEGGCITCEKYGELGDDGKIDYEDVIKFIGKKFWSDIVAVSENLLLSNMKVTITIEER